MQQPSGDDAASNTGTLLRQQREAILRAWQDRPGGTGGGALREHVGQWLDCLIERAAGAPPTGGLPVPPPDLRPETLTQAYAGLREAILRALQPRLGEAGGAALFAVNQGIDQAIDYAVRAHAGGQEARLRDKRARLEAAQLRYRRLFEADIVGILEWRTDGPIVAANDTFLRMIGYSREDLAAGRLNFRRLTPPEHQAATDLAVRTLKVTGRLYPTEKQYLRQDGSRVDIVIGGATLDAANEHGIGFALDISERKRLEADQARRSEFERQLIGIVGHDLRSPLSAINLAASLLLRRPDLDPPLERSLRQILSAADRSQRMTLDLLDFTRVRLSGGIAIEPRPMDLYETALQAVEELRAAHPGRDIAIERRGDSRGEWDPDRLTQLICNLLMNALGYSPADTPVSVRIDGEQEATVRMTLHNLGEPIADELRPHLFEPLRRGAAAARNGIGLGLFIVHHIAAAHGGEVTVESGHRGTSFTVRLPRRSRVSGPGSGPESGAPARSEAG